MRKKTYISISLFMIFILSVFVLFVVSDNHSNTTWITLFFDTFTFLSMWCIGLKLVGKTDKKEEYFYITPMIVIAIVYMLLQLGICLFIAFVGENVSSKLVIFINLIVMFSIWIIIFALICSREHIKKVDLCQKDVHIKL